MTVEARGYTTRLDDWKRAWYRVRRNRLALVGLAVVLAVTAVAVLAPVLAPHPEDAGKVVRFDQAHQPPSRTHPFGTDEIGRDILSRAMFGSRLSIVLGLAVLAIALAIGVPLGLIAGYWGGTVNVVIMRLTDITLAIPPLVLALAVSALFKPSLTNSMIAISFVWWPWYTRLVQGEVLHLKEEQFLEAARGMGAGRWRIMFREILPNCLSPIIVKATLDMGFVILLGAGLSFLGLGAQPPTPAWGTMVAEGRVYLPDNWWAATFPGLAIFVTVMGFNLLGDGLRDLLDVEFDGAGGGA